MESFEIWAISSPHSRGGLTQADVRTLLADGRLLEIKKKGTYMLAKLAGRPWRGMLVINMRFYSISSFSFVSVNACMLSRLLLSMHTILFDFAIK